MAFWDILPGRKKNDNLAPVGSYADMHPRARATLQLLERRLQQGETSDAMELVKAGLQRMIPAPSVGVPDLGFKGARQQLFQRFNLIDLYGMAHNNSTVKTATLSLKQEVFRRGLEWEPAFAFRCTTCLTDYSQEEADESQSTCPSCQHPLSEPDPTQRVYFERLMPQVNIYGQSLLRLMHTLEDDLNIVDDLFILLSSEYRIVQKGSSLTIKRYVRQLYRMDPIFIEFDTDDDNRPGMAHHLCIAHRTNLLDIPRDSGWEYEWKGRCPIDNLPTFPVMYRYVPTRGTYGAQRGGIGTDKDALYLVKGEVIHASKFSPSELYGYPPLLALYEKVLGLIGMDRYLYDYFFERQIPQGVITTVTDNPDDLETRKEQMLAEVLNNPHYIPWLAVSSRTGQGQTNFVRFAYSLDELQFLPVMESLDRAVAGVYGVPDLFMGFESNYGGLGNQSQQVKRMSRGAQSSQEIYNVDVFPVLLEAFGITDWRLKLSEAEERGEQLEWELKASKAGWAQTMAAIGFGVEYNQDEDAFTVSGAVKPMAEQQEEQGQMYGGGQFGMSKQSKKSKKRKVIKRPW